MYREQHQDPDPAPRNIQEMMCIWVIILPQFLFKKGCKIAFNLRWAKGLSGLATKKRTFFAASLRNDFFFLHFFIINSILMTNLSNERVWIASSSDFGLP